MTTATMDAATLPEQRAADPSLRPYGPCPGGGGCRFDEGRAFGAGRHGTVAVHRCATCGHGVTRPAMPDVSALYADRDSQDFQPHSQGLADRIKAFAFRAQARAVLRQANVRPRRMIDFACGSGLLTQAFAEELGPDGSTVTALDFHHEAPGDIAPARYRSFEAADDLKGTADLVTCFHVLEHDDDPGALLSRVAAFVAPGGTLVAEVPNVDVAWARILGRHFDNWYLPYHRVHFSRTSFEALATSEGLADVRVVPARVPSMGRSLARVTGRANTTPFVLLGAALHPVQLAVEFATRQPTALRLIARRA